ncbi:MAG TPA: DUF6795 domain-containing protein [Burkholderiaceae bacterium]
MSALLASRGLWIVLGIVAALFVVVQVTGFGKVVIWSAMKGRVLMNGQPVVGAVLTREYFWHWPNQKGSDRAKTNAAGEFSFPAIERRMILGMVLPHEPVIEQEMTIEHNGSSYQAWAHFKRDYEPNDENNGHPIDVTCRLGEERARHGLVMGLCEFNEVR